MPEKRRSVIHRRHTIIAARGDAGWQARAFRGKKPVTDVLTAADEMAAIDEVRAELDELAAKERAARGDDGYPTPSHFLAAFGQIRESATYGQLAMLYAHLDAPGHVLTATQLSAAAGKPGHEYANLQYGTLARAVAEEMDYTPDRIRKDGSIIWTFALATGAEENVEAPDGDPEVAGEWRWRLRPEVVEALTKVRGDR